VAVTVLASIAIVAPSAQQFEIVSVKPTEPGSRGGPGPFIQTEPGHLIARGTVQFFIEYAYSQNRMYIEGGPGWLRADRFDVDAKQAPGSASFPLMPVMMRAALTDRFKLAVHTETRQLPVLLLMVAKGGPKLQPAAATDEARMTGIPGELRGTKATMAQLAGQLSRSLGRIVRDRTGLTGAYNFTLRATNDSAGPERLGRTLADPDAPSVATALEEQLGLRLESGRGPVDVLMIDRVERPIAD
jgi:uncharacterized protein (TIGR03435 family)